MEWSEEEEKTSTKGPHVKKRVMGYGGRGDESSAIDDPDENIHVHPW